jgi:ABC-type uncharacterized transport system substrate-binding protein
MKCPTVGLIVILALGLLGAPLTADAQRVGKVPRLGYLMLPGAPPQRYQDLREVFLRGWRKAGWVEGQNISIASRSAEEKAERLPDLAAELVRLKVDVIVTSGGYQVTRAAKEATTTMPIVIISPDPMRTGLVASLARPGGNVTGVSILAPDGGRKRLELLKEAVPQAVRVAVLWNAAQRGKESEWQETQVAAGALGVTLHSVELRGSDVFDAAFAAMVRARPDALRTFSEALTLAHQRRIVDFAPQNRLPLISESQEFAGAGGLMTYGASLPALFRRAATYVDKILKGAKPADLPVEQPTTFELVINLKTAQAPGLTIPPSLLFQATEVIR